MLLELADDRVEGRRLLSGTAGDAGAGDPPPLRWREWEAELVEGDRRLLDAVQERLLAAGAQPAAFGSKLGRVLGGGLGRPAEVGLRKASRRETAGRVVVAHLAEQVELLLVHDPAARRDLPDAVHALRVTARRLRSALATFRPLLDRERTDPLRARLRELLHVLGAVRDAEVLAARLQDRIAAEPPELVLGPVSRRLDLVLTSRHPAAHEALVAHLDGEQHLRLLDELKRLVAEPPLLPAAEEPAGEVLPRLVRRAWRRLERALERARRARGAEQEELLHQARRDAKRARYAAEAVQALYRPARRYARELARLQDLLGEHQDGVVTRQALRELAVVAHLAGENAFTFGRLHGLEQAQASALDWESVRGHVPSRKRRRWFERA